MCGLRSVFRSLWPFDTRRAQTKRLVIRPMPGDPEARLTALERGVFELLLEGDHPNLDILRKQLEDCVVIEREMTGVGFFTTVKIADGHPPVRPDLEIIHLDGVYVRTPQLADGAGFVLFIREGYLDFLEGYTYGEPWPGKMEFTLYKVDEGHDDLFLGD